MIKSLFLATILILMAPCGPLWGQGSTEDPFVKEQKDQYPARKYQGIEIINQHGPINISSWDEDSISVEVQISVSAPGEEVAQEVLDKITILVSQKVQNLVYQTLIGEDFFFNYPYSVQYHVFLPRNTPVKIENRFGDINLNSITGPLEVNLEYGQLLHRGIEPIAKLKATLSFADATLVNLSATEMHLSNANVHLQNAGKANISGHFCQTEIGKVDILTIKASTGRFNIGRVNILSITGDYSFPSIDEIAETGHIEITNGLVLIKKVSPNLKELTVSNSNAPLNLALQPELNYTLNGEVKNGEFRHYQAQQFKVIRDHSTLSFSGSNGPLDKSATILLFNKDADININH